MIIGSDGMQLQDSAISLSQGDYPGDSSKNLDLSKLKLASRPRRDTKTSEKEIMGASVVAQVPGPTMGSTVQVVISRRGSRRSSVRSTHSIVVRPFSKKDIFYSGSTLHLKRENSFTNSPINQYTCSENAIGASVVSIPAKDIVGKVFSSRPGLRMRRQMSGVSGIGATSKFTSDQMDMACPVHSSQPDEGCFKKLYKRLCYWSPKKEDEVLCENGQLDQGDVCGNKCTCEEDSNTSESSMWDTLGELLDFGLVKRSPMFLLLAISNVIGMMGFYIPFVFISQHIVENVRGI